MRRGRRKIPFSRRQPQGGRLDGFAEKEFCLFGQMLSGRMVAPMIDLAARI
jgi:hypothetical protein